jgi:VWFA-related protein
LRIPGLLAAISFAGAAGLAMGLVPEPAQAQTQEPKVSITPRNQLRSRTAPVRPNIRSDVTMVLVPVTVTDATDHPVTDLSPDSFRLFEDGVEQDIVSLAHEDGPVSVGFIFDTSSSMKNRMDRSIEAVRQFLKTLTPQDEFFLVQFADRPKLATGFTRDPDEILSALSFVQPIGWTALHDAICLGIQRMKSAKNSRRALIVLSDGGDNDSRYTESEVRDLVRESDVRIYSIGIYERPRLLEKLAADSGGRAFWAKRIEDLPDTVDRLSREFRSVYVVGYSSKNQQNDGKYRKVRVELLETIKRMPLNVFWRRGYFAPPD